MIIVLTTCPVKNSEKIREIILKEKLAAGALSIPMNESKFWWKGKLDSEKEDLLVFKTSNKKSEKIFKKIKELHSYEVPFIAQLDIDKVNSEFEKWINDVTN